jgi:hypothetical protein
VSFYVDVPSTGGATLNINGGTGDAINILGGALRTAGSVAISSNMVARVASSQSFLESYGAFPLVLAAYSGAAVRVQANGGLAVRNDTNSADAPLTAGAGTFSGDLLPAVNNTHSLGSFSPSQWNFLFLGGGIYIGGSSCIDGSRNITAGAITASGIVKLGIKTIATLPSAASSSGDRYQVSDSATIANRIVFSNGSAWYYEGTPVAV